MKLPGVCALVAASRGLVNAYPGYAELELLPRALPNSPDGYTPSHGDCPSNAPSIRSAATLSPNETAWLELRRRNTVEPMREFLTRMNISGFDAGGFIDRVSRNTSELPNVAIAFSGGGWRALLNGAGGLAAFDSRTNNSTNSGQIGGLLQSATYVAGLSGGSWLVGSVYVNNFTTVESLQSDTAEPVWDFRDGIIKGPSTDDGSSLSTLDYYTTVIRQVNGKRDAGFQTSITDLWARALSYQMINASDAGPKYTWSSIALMQAFQNADQPFPIVIADARAPGETVVSLNATIFEFTPFEMGTHDPRAFGFVPTQYLGTQFNKGRVVHNDRCVTGFDNAGFIMGTSSSLFNQALHEVNLSASGLPSAIATTLTNYLDDLNKDSNDIADYSPNPFYGYNPDINPNAGQTRLTLVDGGEDGQNIPLQPLIQPDRHVDVIFAVDSSADINPPNNNYPNGTALVATYQRQFSSIANGTAFPSSPTKTRCNGYTGLDVPLIVYIPNAPYSVQSDPSTFTLKYNTTYRNALIQNGYDVATMGNGTVDKIWPTCVGCAVIARSLERTGTKMPQACKDCFAKFCWDGTLNSTRPNTYNPSPKLDGVSAQNGSSDGSSGGGSSGGSISDSDKDSSGAGTLKIRAFAAAAVALAALMITA